jgi:hypothetical protein
MEMDKILEKKVTKYVIATLGAPTMYVKKVYQQKKYVFTDDIEYATKTISKDVAQIILDYYYSDTGDNMDLVIIPVEITYSLINERV